MQFTLIRSNRKTIAININPDLTVTVRAPYGVSNKEIKRVLQTKESWINKHIEKLKEQQVKYAELGIEALTATDISDLKKRAAQYIPKRVEFFASLIGVDYGRITIRAQKTRWGSCSSKGNLNFNCLLMLAPPDAIDYVVVHELCHRKEMNHSKKFWELVANYIPDYKTTERWLKTEGSLLMRKLNYRY